MITNYKIFEDYKGDKIRDFAKAFANFLNSFDPTLKCYDTKDYTIMRDYNKSLISISQSNNFLTRVILLYDINFYFTEEQLKNISEFIGIEPERTDMYINRTELDKYIKGLTIENYNIFLIEKEGKKYNL